MPGVARHVAIALGKVRRSCSLSGYDRNESNRTVRRIVEENEGLRLELSSEGRYALRALLYLAWTGERMSAQRISAEAHIPRRLLARILATLSREGLVESEQGRNGGSKLARPAGGITLREAVEAVEGPFGVTNCIMADRTAGWAPLRPTRGLGRRPACYPRLPRHPDPRRFPLPKPLGPTAPQNLEWLANGSTS